MQVNNESPRGTTDALGHVVHVTTVHARSDTRIFLKECCSLANAGYAVSLIVADGKGDEVKSGVRIHDVGKENGRVGRMVRASQRALEKAIALDGSVYHLHDPELIRVGLSLKRHNKQVIFDAHEDVPKQVLSKPYLKPYQKWLVSRLFGLYEDWACRKFDAVVTATPAIRNKFGRINSVVVDVNNFPISNELFETAAGSGNKERKVCFVGGISAKRGIRELAQAMRLVESGARLALVGAFEGQELASELRREPGWDAVDELGWLGRSEVREVLSRSMAGVVTFLPEPNHLDSQPNKMFEYMSAGIPVIASDFPLWREIIIGNDCGLCVDPTSPKAIAGAIDSIVGNPARAKEMGDNGRRAVLDVYNWGKEEAKLLNLYSKVVDSKDSK